MRRASLAPLFATLLGAQGTAPALPGEVRLGIGIFNVAKDGRDVLLQVRPPGWKLSLGLRYVQWTDTFQDPYTGNALTDTTERMAGATVLWVFHPTWRGSWVVGTEVLHCSKVERSRIDGSEGRDEVTAPFFGGGFQANLGRWGQAQLGIYLSPGTRLRTQTNYSSEDDSGRFDIHVMWGVRF